MERGSVERLLRIYDEWHEAYILERLFGQDLIRGDRVELQWRKKRIKLFNHLLRTVAKRRVSEDKVDEPWPPRPTQRRTMEQDL